MLWSDNMLERNARLWKKVLLGTFVFTLGAEIAQAGSLCAKKIYQATGVQGGLVVHVGCGDARLTASLRRNERYLVHGLDADSQCIAKARESLHAKGLYGAISVSRLDGQRLPFVGNTVNLLVITDSGSRISDEEILRVLAPRGAAIALSNSPASRLESSNWQPASSIGDGYVLLRKPIPPDTDQWSHFLHDASGNAVANDRQVGPPNRLRWVAGPRWCRSHEIPSSVNAVVTAGGRIFTIFDEGPTGVYKGLPQNCKLIARDAANGLLLWKVPMRRWQPEFGTGVGVRYKIHHTIPRRLIAEGDRVYVTLAFLDSPVSVLDAATGQILTEAIEGTKGTDEMLLSDGILIVKITKKRSVAATDRFGRERLDDTLAAIDVKTGKPLWRQENTRVVPYALSSSDGRIVYHNMDELVCLSAKTGDELWRVPNSIRSTVGGGSTLVIANGIVLFHGHGDDHGLAASASVKNKGRNGLCLTALSLYDGKPLWSHPGGRGRAGACTQPTDLFVVDGTVWCAGSVRGRDLHTGEFKKTLTIRKLISPGHHHRCHRSKATERFLIWPKRGAEFVDLEGQTHMRFDWLRAPCFTGVTPANGLLYVPPSQCFCYPGVKLSGFLALAHTPHANGTARRSDEGAQLEKGPAYGLVDPSSLRLHPSKDWPMYRRDGQRSGSTTVPVPTDLKRRWERQLTCTGTQPVIVGNRLCVAEKDAHRIRCLDATDGKDIWNFTAGGRIDSSPTIYGDAVLFGCRDGSVVCLRADTGELVWRFHAAPVRHRIVSYEQLESLWPVHGSVLVQDDMVYFAAGRSSFLDGGIWVYGLDVKTGHVRCRHHLEGPWPDISKDVGRPFAMEGALPDLIVSDGTDLYMQRIKFDAALKRLNTTQESDLGELDMGANHLVATGGFLDDTGFDRLYWMYGKRWPGYYFAQESPKAGQLVVFGDTTTYAVKYFHHRTGGSPAFVPANHGYLLFADDNRNEPALDEPGQPKAPAWRPEGSAGDPFGRGGRGAEKGRGYVRLQPPKWQAMIPLRVRAMVLAGQHLFAAGTPDELDPRDPLASFDGRKDAVLQVFSAKDGTLLTSKPIPAPPVFDGLSAAGGRLYLVTRKATIVCYGGSSGN